MSQKKIVIMTVPFGGGHFAIAQTIASLLKARDPDLSVDVIDVISDAWPAFSKRSTDLYVNSSSSSGGIWYRIYYQLADWWPYPMQWFAQALFGGYARKQFETLKPDLIIATFPLLGYVASKARNHYHSKTPIITFVTDASNVQGIWLSGHEDVILTATEDTVAYAKRRKLGRAQVKHIGFPVAPEFYEKHDVAQLRKELELKDIFTVMVTAGGFGTHSDRVLSLAEGLAASKVPLQIIFVAGMNTGLQDALKKIVFPDNVRVQIHGYTSFMSRLMYASDVVCSKAGWITINEVLTVGRPLLLFDAIPGQEERNVSYVIKQGFGMFEEDMTKLSKTIMQMAVPGSILRDPFLAAIKRRGQQADVPVKIATYCIDLMGYTGR